MHVCPSCGYTRSTAERPEQTTMSFGADRRCVQCGCLWRPACPRWAGAVFAVIGLFFTGMPVVSLLIGRFPGMLIFGLLIFGVPAIAYGFGVLFGMAGKMEVLEDASPRRF